MAVAELKRASWTPPLAELFRGSMEELPPRVKKPGTPPAKAVVETE
jgi:membrane glycosyltransferase